MDKRILSVDDQQYPRGAVGDTRRNRRILPIAGARHMPRMRAAERPEAKTSAKPRAS